jgi:hypothetical protein
MGSKRTSPITFWAVVMSMSIVAALLLTACSWSGDQDPRTVESTPALFLDDSDLPAGWIVTSPPTKPRRSRSDYAVSLLGPAVGPRNPPGGRLEIRRALSAEDAAKHYNGQLNLPLQYTQVPEGFTAFPRKAAAYRLGCDPFKVYLHCLYKARYDAYTVNLQLTLEPLTAAADLANIISAIERRVGSGP